MPNDPDYVEPVDMVAPPETVDYRVPKAIDQAVRLISWRKEIAQGKKVPLQAIIDECTKHGVQAAEVRLFVTNNPAVVLAPARIQH